MSNFNLNILYQYLCENPQSHEHERINSSWDCKRKAVSNKTFWLLAIRLIRRLYERNESITQCASKRNISFCADFQFYLFVYLVWFGLVWIMQKCCDFGRVLLPLCVQFARNIFLVINAFQRDCWLFRARSYVYQHYSWISFKVSISIFCEIFVYLKKALLSHAWLKTKSKTKSKMS